MKKRIEILAPAGSFDSMKAAVAAGADAVYMGGSRFGARAFADNPDEEKLMEAIDYVHLHGCRLYMTVNTLVKERELQELVHYLLPYYERGLDAVIVQDMGVFARIRECFPDLPIHASTQMTITGPLGARLMTEMGAARIVTARELSLEEILAIYEETGAEIESFVHGALCFCYSGQCLFSSLIGGRSGNRGRCAQTCRLPFEVKRDGNPLNNKEERYVCSLKDLCTLDILPDLIEAGVYSMKIEGRMKSPRYTAGVVSIYRKYADLYLERGRAGYRVAPEDRKKLSDLFDRGGQTEGYYREHNGRDMAVLKEKPAFRRENRELYDYLDQTYVEAVLKKPVTGRVSVRVGEPVLLSLECGGASVTVTGGRVQTAKNQPMSEEKIRKQIEKTGNTPFYFESLTVETEGSPFLPVQELNELRRNGFEELTEAILAPYRRTSPVSAAEQEDARITPAGANGAADANGAAGANGTTGADGETGVNGVSGTAGRRYEINVSLEQPEGLTTVLAESSVSGVYLDAAAFGAGDWASAAEECHESGKKCLLLMPHIYRSEAERYFKAHRKEFLHAGFDGAVLRSWEEAELMKEWAPDMPVVVDYGLYTMNNEARRMIGSMLPGNPKRFTLPVELNSRELEELGCRGTELIVYGHIPVMVTAQCMKKTLEKCTKRPELLQVKDRMGKEFPVKNHCRFCYNTIYNCTPLSLLQDKRIIDRLAPDSIRLSFTVENPDMIGRVIRAFAKGFAEGCAEVEESALSGAFTRGHFKRGIE